MRQPRIDRLRKRRLQLLDLFRDRPQSCHVRVRVAATFIVVNDRETFSQGVSKSDNRVGFGGLPDSAKATADGKPPLLESAIAFSIVGYCFFEP